jgi:hypothetical protein
MHLRSLFVTGLEKLVLKFLSKMIRTKHIHEWTKRTSKDISKVRLCLHRTATTRRQTDNTVTCTCVKAKTYCTDTARHDTRHGPNRRRTREDQAVLAWHGTSGVKTHSQLLTAYDSGGACIKHPNLSKNNNSDAYTIIALLKLYIFLHYCLLCLARVYPTQITLIPLYWCRDHSSTVKAKAGLRTTRPCTHCAYVLAS